MSLAMSEELRIFFYSILGGALIMLLYDVFSATFKKDNRPLLVVTVCDGIFVVTACTITVFITLSVSRGMVRFYEFVGLVLGATFYKLTISRLFCLLFSKILYGFYTFSKIFFKILLTPLLFMYKMINRCIRWLFCPIGRLLKRFAHYLYRVVSKTIWDARKTIRKT